MVQLEADDRLTSAYVQLERMAHLDTMAPASWHSVLEDIERDHSSCYLKWFGHHGGE